MIPTTPIPSSSNRNLAVLYFLFSGFILGAVGMSLIGSCAHLGFEVRQWFFSAEVQAYRANDPEKLHSLESGAQEFERHVEHIADHAFLAGVVMIGFGALHLVVVAAMVLGSRSSSERGSDAAP